MRAALMPPTGRPAAQASSPITIVTAARLLDPRSGNVLSPAAVVVEDGKVKQVGELAQVSAPDGATTIDLGDATLLPGSIDSHTHILLNVMIPPEAEIDGEYNPFFAPSYLLTITESQSSTRCSASAS
jgi:imidazolonepropionase-like amidohydrolase